MNPKTKNLLVSILAVSLLFGEGTLASSFGKVVLDAEAPWPRKHHDHRNTGQSPYPGPVFPELTGTRQPVSEGGMVLYNFNYDLRTSPAVGPDATVYAANGTTPIFAIRPDGSLKWDTDGIRAGDSLHSSPALGRETPSGRTVIYMGERNNKLIAISDDGEAGFQTDWMVKFRVDGDITGSPNLGLDGDQLYASCGCVNGGYLVAYRTEPSPDLVQQPQLPGVPAGDIRWTADNRGMSGVAPAINDNVGDPNYGDIYVLDSSGRVEVYSPDGVARWRSVGMGHQSQKTAPVIAQDGDVFIATDRGVHRVVPPATGVSEARVSTDWFFPTVGRVRAIPAYADCIKADNPAACEFNDTLYFGDSDGWFYALDGNTGELLWYLQLGRAVTGSAVIDHHGVVYVGTEGDATVFALRPDRTDLPSSKRILWQHTLGGRVRFQTPVIGVLPEYSAGGEVLRDPASGRILGQPRLYVGSRHTLFAITGDGAPPPVVTGVEDLPEVATAWDDFGAERLRFSRRVRLGVKRPLVRQKVKFRLRNQGTAPFVVTEEVLTKRVRLVLTPIDSTTTCQAPMLAPDQRSLSLGDAGRTLRPGEGLTLRYEVIFSCAPDPGMTNRRENHDDYAVRVDLVDSTGGTRSFPAERFVDVVNPRGR